MKIVKLGMVVVTLILMGCGDKAAFYGGSQATLSDPIVVPPEEPPKALDQVPEVLPPPPPLPPPAPAIASQPPTRLVDWYWSCDTDKDKVFPQSTGDDRVILADQGDHPLAYDQSTPTEFKFKGRVCPPAQLNRDLVFVVDVSGSMIDNDPRINDSCARLDALQKLLQTLTNTPESPNSVRFGVVTFSSSLMTYSTGLYASAQKFFDDLSKSGKPADVLCVADGGTNYDSGITKAAELLQGGRAGATKEIYLVSDGQPTVGQEGIELATFLKSKGVTIAGTTPIKVTLATLMLKGVDTVLESKIASRDSNGKALHSFVQNVQDLGKALGSLSESRLVKAELRVSQIPSQSDLAPQVNVIDIMPHLKQFAFELPPFQVNWIEPRASLKVDVIYTDSHGRMQEKHGTVLQKDQP